MSYKKDVLAWLEKAKAAKEQGKPWELYLKHVLWNYNKYVDKNQKRWPKINWEMAKAWLERAEQGL